MVGRLGAVVRRFVTWWWWFGRLIVGLIGWRLAGWHPRGAWAEDERRRRFDVAGRNRIAAIERGMGTCNPLCLDDGADRIDAENKGGRGQRGTGVGDAVACLDRVDFGREAGFTGEQLRHREADLGEIEVDGEAIGEGGCDVIFGAGFAFIEEHECWTVGVEGVGEAGGDRGGQAFGHGDQQDEGSPLSRLAFGESDLSREGRGKEAGAVNRVAGGEGGSEVEAAVEGFGVGAGGQAAEGGDAGEGGGPGVADRAGAGAEENAAQARA